jgi:hypothetical protein
VDQQQFISFVRHCGLAVIATRGSDGAPQAALVGITATGRGELVFDTSRSSRKCRNLSSYAQIALVVGWENEMTVQCEGIADIPTGVDRDRCLEAYFAQYPDGVERAHDHDIVHVRVRQAGCVTAITGPGPLPWRRSLGVDSNGASGGRGAPSRVCTIADGTQSWVRPLLWGWVYGLSAG